MSNVGVKETIEVINAGFDVAIAGLKLKNNGLAGGLADMLPLYNELKTAWDGKDQIKAELNDLDAQEIEQVVTAINQGTMKLLLAMGLDPNSQSGRIVRNLPRAAALANMVYREGRAIAEDIKGPEAK